MPNDFFKFKQFTVFQNKDVFKVSTDSVLLGSWGNYHLPGNILDIGTGTGILALMMAQRFAKAQVDAVEISPEAAAVAGQNFKQSPFGNRIRLYLTGIREFAEQYAGDKQYDLIISNPPYYFNQKPAATLQKNIQKHNRLLTPKDLIAAVKDLLSPAGDFAMVMAYDEGKDFIATARFAGLHYYKITEVFARSSHRKPKRLLLLFSKTKKEKQSGKLYILNDNNEYSETYRSITKKFMQKQKVGYKAKTCGFKK